jgi:hypothetical protein
VVIVVPARMVSVRFCALYRPPPKVAVFPVTVVPSLSVAVPALHSPPPRIALLPPERVMLEPTRVPALEIPPPASPPVQPVIVTSVRVKSHATGPMDVRGQPVAPALPLALVNRVPPPAPLRGYPSNTTSPLSSTSSPALPSRTSGLGCSGGRTSSTSTAGRPLREMQASRP